MQQLLQNLPFQWGQMVPLAFRVSLDPWSSSNEERETSASLDTVIEESSDNYKTFQVLSASWIFFFIFFSIMDIEGPQYATSCLQCLSLAWVCKMCTFSCGPKSPVPCSPISSLTLPIPQLCSTYTEMPLGPARGHILPLNFDFPSHFFPTDNQPIWVYPAPTNYSPWLPIRIFWGNFKKFWCPELSQNLWE